MLFSLIYWAAGGTGFCYWDPVSNSTTAAVTSSTVSSAIASATESTISTTSIVSSTTATLLENWKCDTVSREFQSLIILFLMFHHCSSYIRFWIGEDIQDWQLE